MGENTKIEWADHSWSPWWGCTKVSPACTHCYAEALADRFRPDERLWRGNRARTKDWRKPLSWHSRAKREGRSLRVFPSMCDPFDDHPALPPWRADFFDLIDATPNLTWLLLTKRPQNIRRMVPSSWLEDWPSHVWTGATVEDQERADERIPHLLGVPGPHFLSCEPLLGPVDLRSVRSLGGMLRTNALTCFNGVDSFGTMPGIQWVIAGGESGPKARPSHPDWFRSLRDQCADAGVMFHFKQWGSWIPRSHTTRRHPWHAERVPDGDPSWRVDFHAPAAWGTLDATGTLWPATTPWNGHDDDGVGGEALVLRSTAARAGRLLDGRTHDEVP